MLLPKIRTSRRFQLFKQYAVWLMFSTTVLALVNAFSSLDKIRSYGFPSLDMLLTFGFLVFIGCLEALALTLALVLLELFLEHTFQKNLHQLFRLVVVVIYAASWFAGLLAIFRIL